MTEKLNPCLPGLPVRFFGFQVRTCFKNLTGNWKQISDNLIQGFICKDSGDQPGPKPTWKIGHHIKSAVGEDDIAGRVTVHKPQRSPWALVHGGVRTATARQTVLGSSECFI